MSQKRDMGHQLLKDRRCKFLEVLARLGAFVIFVFYPFSI